MENKSFFKNHADTLAIMGLNLAIAAILISMWVSNTSRVDATNTRIDAAIASDNARWNQLFKDFHEETKDFHARLERQDAEFKAHLIYQHSKKEEE